VKTIAAEDGICSLRKSAKKNSKDDEEVDGLEKGSGTNKWNNERKNIKSEKNGSRRGGGVD